MGSIKISGTSIRGKSRRRGSSLAGALVVIMLAMSGEGRAGAGEQPAIRRMVPSVFAQRATPPATDAVPTLVRAHLVDLPGTWQRTWPGEGLLGHFLSRAMGRTVGLSRVLADFRNKPTVTVRDAPVPAFPGLPGLVLTTPLLVPEGSKNVHGELRTALSEVVDSSGALLGVFGRTLFTSPSIVESQPFLMDADGKVRPLTNKECCEALRQHDTLLIGEDPRAFPCLVAKMHFPAGEIPVDQWFASGGTPTTWAVGDAHWGAVTETRGTGAGAKRNQVRIRGLDRGEIVIPLHPGAVERRTRLVKIPGADGADPTQFATLPTVRDWRFVLDPHPTAGALLVPLPTTGVGIAAAPSDRYSTTGSADEAARPRDRTGSGAQGLPPEQAQRLLTGQTW